MAEPDAVRIQPIQKLKVADAIAAQLEQLIRDGQYLVGSKLPPERELAEQLGVARSTIREGLRILESSGFVRIVHGVGALVEADTPRSNMLEELLSASGTTVRELFEVREALESKAAELAARRRSDADLSKMRALLEEAGQADIGNERFIELDALFHASVARATANRLMATIFDNIGSAFTEYSQRVIDLPGRRARAHVGHERIYECIASQDGSAAREAALTHLRDVERDIQATFTR